MLENAPSFLLSNPTALQKKYRALKDNPNMTRTGRGDLRESVKAAEQSALEMLVGLFDWLDSLDPQPMAGIVPLSEESQKVEAMKTDTPALIGPARAENAKNSPVSFHFACNRWLDLIYVIVLSDVQRSAGPKTQSRSRGPTSITFARCPTAI